jgi:LysM repeat protein
VWEDGGRSVREDKAVRPNGFFVGLVGLAASVSLAAAQGVPPAGAAAQPVAPAGLQTGPAEVAPHWTKNTGFPTSIAEGASYHIVERGDTLWDLASRYLGNPYLWPQIWDTNKYITDAHWIYPGDPVVLPQVAVVTEGAGEVPPGPGPEGVGEEKGLFQPGVPGEEGGAAAEALRPVTEETQLQCAMYIASSREKEDLYVVGSELGGDKVALSTRDIVYLNHGSNYGVKAGDLYSLHHYAYDVRHPATGRKIGVKVETTGWVKVILVSEDSASAVIEQACADVHAGDYLKPFERVNVPMVVSRPPADRLTPPSGKLDQYIVDIQDDATIAGVGHFVAIDAGLDEGVSPGSVFSIYRVMYPSVPTPRNVVGEATVVAVRNRTAGAKITYSSQEIMVGDRAELR